VPGIRGVYLQSLRIINEFPIISIISLFRIPLLRKLNRRNALGLSILSIRQRDAGDLSNLDVK